MYAVDVDFARGATTVSETGRDPASGNGAPIFTDESFPPAGTDGREYLSRVERGPMRERGFGGLVPSPELTEYVDALTTLAVARLALPTEATLLQA
jgi:hypothetical protein